MTKSYCGLNDDMGRTELPGIVDRNGAESIIKRLKMHEILHVQEIENKRVIAVATRSEGIWDWKDEPGQEVDAVPDPDPET